MSCIRIYSTGLWSYVGDEMLSNIFGRSARLSPNDGEKIALQSLGLCRMFRRISHNDTYLQGNSSEAIKMRPFHGTQTLISFATIFHCVLIFLYILFCILGNALSPSTMQRKMSRIRMFSSCLWSYFGDHMLQNVFGRSARLSPNDGEKIALQSCGLFGMFHISRGSCLQRAM